MNGQDQAGVGRSAASGAPRDDAGQRVARYVGALQRRATLLYGLRALSAASGACAVALLMMASLSGPVITPRMSTVTIALLVSTFVAAGLWLLWPLRRLRGLGSCTLLEPVAPELASRVRSTLQLRAQQAAGASPALVSAHAVSVRDAVADMPARRVVPYTWLRHPSVTVGLAALTTCALAFGLDRDLQGSAYALFHPARLDADGSRIAPVVSSSRARLVYPSYLAMKPAEAADADQLRVPRGTTVELTIMPRVSSHHGALVIGDTHVRLRPVPDGGLFARFVAREDAALHVRIESDGEWYQDSAPRSIEALADQVPTARLLTPTDGAIVEADSPVRVRYSSQDDHGLASLELAVRLPDGAEQRRRLWSSVSSDGPRKALDDATVITPAEMGGQPGDVLVMWIEARDADAVSGPNVGISEAATVEVASDAQKLSLHVPRLQELLDGVLDLLADRLEATLPDDAVLARQRMQELHAGLTPWIERITQLIADADREGSKLPIDVDQLSGIRDRTRREMRREESAYRGSGKHLKRWRDTDARMVEEHEQDTLLLADTLAQALVDEARAITDELSELKQHIRELLEEYQKEQSPELRRALMAEIAKAARRLRELSQSLGRLSKRVPSEFINREALERDSARSSIEELKDAIERGDMDAAEEHLDALASQIDELASAIDSGGNRFRESRFGAHDRAMAQAQQRVGMLAEEQQRLAQRSRDVVQRATERAQRQDAPRSETRALGEMAEQIEEQLEALGGHNQGSHESRLLDRAKSRVRDTRDALSTGDMAEANRMASAAQRSLDQAAHGIGADAQMFPGHLGETSDRARAAQQASDDLRQLQQRIAEQTPGLGEHVTDGERRQMRGDAPAQRGARELAEQLGDQLAKGPGDAPLSPEGERALRDAARAMREAEQALERGEPQQAALAQEEASERVAQAQERMRGRRGNQGQQQEGTEPGDSGGGDGQRSRVDGPVRIHGADEYTGPVEMRRRLLDAMKEPPPHGFEGAVERYYQELLQ